MVEGMDLARSSRQISEVDLVRLDVFEESVALAEGFCIGLLDESNPKVGFLV